jgi:hypothetical protein
LEVDISATTLADAEKINSGRVLDVDFSPYRDGGRPLVQLISLIKVTGDDGITVSLQEWRNAVRDTAAGKTGSEILKSSLAGEDFKKESAQAVAQRAAYVAAGMQAKDEAEDALNPEYVPFLCFVARALKTMGAGHLEVGMYSNPYASRLATFDWGPDHGIFYRKEVARWQNAGEHLAAMHAGQPTKEAYQWAYGVMEEEIVHESIHARLRHGEVWSHGADPRWKENFARHYKDTVLTLIRAEFDEFGLA